MCIRDSTDTTTFTWTVADINQPPVLNSIDPQTDAEGDTVSVFAVATDPDTNNTITYTTTSPLPPGLQLTPNGEISGTLTFASAGTYPITIVATDDGTPNLTDTTTFTWTVTDTNRAPVVTVAGLWAFNEDEPVTIQPIGSDPDGDTFTYDATGLPTGLDIDPTTGEISGVLDFETAGSYPVQVLVDDGSLEGTTSTSIVIFNVNRPPVVAPLGNLTNEEGDTITLQPVLSLSLIHI